MSPQPEQAVLTDEGFLAHSPANGVGVRGRHRHKVNFHSWICDLTPGCSENCREARSPGLIEWLNKREVLRIGTAGLEQGHHAGELAVPDPRTTLGVGMKTWCEGACGLRTGVAIMNVDALDMAAWMPLPWD